MAIIKTVTNGNGSAEFKAVSFGHAITVAFGLVSIIGAQQTWLWAGAHERAAIVKELKADFAASIAMHDTLELAKDHDIDRRVTALELSMDDAQRQININTGKLEHHAERGNR